MSNCSRAIVSILYMLTALSIWSGQPDEIYKKAASLQADKFSEFVASGVDLNADEEYCPAICKAAMAQNVIALDNLVRARAKLNTKARCQPLMYLFSAPAYERPVNQELLRRFLDSGASVDAVSAYCHDIQRTDEIQVTALMFAAQRGDITTMQTLIDYGANVNLMTKYGSALTTAVVHCSASAAELLINRGAKVHQVGTKLPEDTTGHGYAFPICSADKALPIFALLEKNGFSYDTQDSRYLRLPMDLSVLKYLIGKGHKLSPRDKNATEILSNLLNYGYFDEYKILAERVSLHQKNRALSDALNSSVSSCDLEKAKKLISMGATINRVSKAAVADAMGEHSERNRDCGPIRAYLRSKGLK